MPLTVAPARMQRQRDRTGPGHRPLIDWHARGGRIARASALLALIVIGAAVFLAWPRLEGAAPELSAPESLSVGSAGLEFEVVWLIPADLLTPDDSDRSLGVQPLDLDAEIARFGRDTVGGVGISSPVGA